MTTSPTLPTSRLDLLRLLHERGPSRISDIAAYYGTRAGYVAHHRLVRMVQTLYVRGLLDYAAYDLARSRHTYAISARGVAALRDADEVTP